MYGDVVQRGPSQVCGCGCVWVWGGCGYWAEQWVCFRIADLFRYGNVSFRLPSDATRTFVVSRRCSVVMNTGPDGSGAAWRIQAALEDKAAWDAYFADPSSPQPELNPLQTYYVGFAGWKNKTDGVKLRFVWPTPGRRSPEAPAFGLHDSCIRNRSEDKVCPTGGGGGGLGLDTGLWVGVGQRRGIAEWPVDTIPSWG